MVVKYILSMTWNEDEFFIMNYQKFESYILKCKKFVNLSQIEKKAYKTFRTRIYNEG